jgi:hypothetical protein
MSKIPFVDELELQADTAEKEAGSLREAAGQLRSQAELCDRKAESLTKLAEGYRRAAQLIKDSVKDIPQEIVEESMEDILERAKLAVEGASVALAGRAPGDERRDEGRGGVRGGGGEGGRRGAALLSGQAKKWQFTMGDTVYADFLSNDAGTLRVDFRYPVTDESEVYRTILKNVLPSYKEKGAQYRMEMDEEKNIRALFADNLEPWMLIDLEKLLEKAIHSDVKEGKASLRKGRDE